mgnify:CR=1 FL=1
MLVDRRNAGRLGIVRPGPAHLLAQPEEVEAGVEDAGIRFGQPELGRAEHAAFEQRKQWWTDPRQVVAQQQVVVGEDRDPGPLRQCLRE